MSEAENRLGRDVYMALAAIGWADGNLDQDEADAIVRTALEEGLALEEIAEIEEATKTPVKLEQIKLDRLTKEDRLFIYAVASWMIRIDGVVHDQEVKTLSDLGDTLKIPAAPRAHADAIASEVASLPDGDRPDRYDIPRVRKLIAERLAEARRLRETATANPQ
jgi:uncharacterized membrane protein YebE (DUF533 family)